MHHFLLLGSEKQGSIHIYNINFFAVIQLYDNTIFFFKFQGYYDINTEVFLSLPCILGTSGVCEVIKTRVKEDRVTEKLQSSASSIHGLQQQLKL